MGYESKVNPAVAFPDAEIADEVWSEYTNDPLYLGYVKDGPLDWERLTHLKGYVCFNYSSMNGTSTDCVSIKIGDVRLKLVTGKLVIFFVATVLFKFIIG